MKAPRYARERVGVRGRAVGRISDKMRAVEICGRWFRQDRETCAGRGTCGEHGIHSMTAEEVY
jgi:hypothetical protein